MKYIAYYRVSTQKQGQSGLGLEAQRSAVDTYVKSEGGKLVESFTEIETGTSKRHRPELQKAVDACKRRGATLAIAKLDRLARNVHFISGLKESGVQFVAADNPKIDNFTVHILAAVAEHEAKMISERTKAALAAAKRRGVRLGNPTNLSTKAARKGNAANVAAAQAHNVDVLPIARKLRDRGRSLTEIAAVLTGRGLRTRRGKAWSPTAVMRLLAS
jgi:DNA invertase Pin-like site-specific DNA recombinase